MFAAGAALAWNASSLDEAVLAEVLNRDVYEDSSGKIGSRRAQAGFRASETGREGSQ